MTTSPLSDPEAELTVVGACIYCEEGSRLAHSRLTSGDIEDLALRALFDSSPLLPLEPAFDGTDVHAPLLWQVRATAAAEATGIRLDEIVEVIHRRLVLVDASGYFARRVKAAADARRRLMDLADQARTYGYELHRTERAA